jgi:hypothetical protein
VTLFVLGLLNRSYCQAYNLKRMVACDQAVFIDGD